jgi:hypothetical protein
MPAFDQEGSAREVLTRAWSFAGELVRGPSGAFREAIEEVVTLSFLLDGILLSAMAGIVKGFAKGPPSDEDVRATLSAWSNSRAGEVPARCESRLRRIRHRWIEATVVGPLPVSLARVSCRRSAGGCR